ncbi:MAG: isoprenyl transferase [Cyclobacteriaceae bacterium]|nr:isoprenyl transferase [Cyclobacteriaceae bacterium HetDA_MAG_MS6]
MKEQIDQYNLPKHIAVIMDGNGRWAKNKGAIRLFGHKSAIKAVRETTELSAELGVEHLTLFAFSTENWARPKYEVDGLMSLLVATVKEEIGTLQENNVRLTSIGDISKLPRDAQENLQTAIQKTESNSGLNLILALNYSGKWDILEATKKISNEVCEGKLNTEDVNEEVFNAHLTTSNIPDPELLIRTSGEMRISNFLLWQTAYSELYFTDVLWPDFRREHLVEAISAYQKRERRFGKTSEQVSI